MKLMGKTDDNERFVQNLQTELKMRGVYDGNIDAWAGSLTYQAFNELLATCVMKPDTDRVTINDDASTTEEQYARMYSTAKVNAKNEGSVDWYVKRMKAGRSRYEVVSKLAGGNIPWWIIAALHALECSCDFNKHLHNGDPLARKTVRVPKGRPLTDSWTWESSAVDALRRLGFHEVKNWTIGHALDHLEKYNGLGYRNKGVPSPYLWSFTQHYFKGKYVADHKYDPNAVSKQPGAAALLIALGVK